jgi:hypothetical protein
MNGWKDFKTEVKTSVINTGVGFCRSQRGIRGGAKLVKGIRKLVDRWAKCVVKQGSMSKNKTQTISKCTLVKNYYIIPVI